MPTLQIFSDLHTELHADNGRALIESLNPHQEARIAVVAGDTKTWKNTGDVYKFLADNFQDVVCVLGNHDYWGGSVNDPWYHVPAMRSNVHVLENQTVELDGVKFHGATGWFPSAPGNYEFEHMMPDFYKIKDFNPWVYERNEQTRKFLEENVHEDDVVITHHIPFDALVAPRWRGYELNRFFVAGFECVHELCQPALWAFGHTHDSHNDFHEFTNYICNPYGYQRSGLNSQFDKELLVHL